MGAVHRLDGSPIGDNRCGLKIYRPLMISERKGWALSSEGLLIIEQGASSARRDPRSSPGDK
jgi:hypothetical protein